jgi:uncharacterized protein YneF (UPF0154 family)
MSEDISHLSNLKKNKTTAIIILVFVCLLLCISSGFFFYQYWKLQKQVNTKQITQEEVKKITGQVGRLMLLPTNETPTIATITDITKLNGQVFFKNAHNGDKVLIYSNNREAILYNPQKNIIVNVAPVNFEGTQPAQTGVARISIRNGTTVQGLAAKIQSDLEKAFPGINIISTDQSKHTDYDKTIVVPLSDAAKNASSDIAKNLNALTGPLPSIESKPDGVDILIILGKDRQ